MKIWAKLTFKDGEQVQRLTLKVEGKGEEAELEIALGEPQITLSEGVNPRMIEETSGPNTPSAINAGTTTDGELPSEDVPAAEPAAEVEDTPETPVEAEPEAKVEEAPETPVEAEPEAEVEEAPETPVEAEPEAEVEEAPEIPVEPVVQV